MADTLPRRPGPIGFRLAATGADGLDWPRLEATWALAGDLGTFDAGWMSDHLSDASRERGGAAFESLTAAAALAHLVPNAWVGIAVVAATFRHPAVLAKAATVLDHATRGRFILGIGAGWHAGEHEAFGIDLPPLPERYDRFAATLAALEGLFGPAAADDAGVTLTDAHVRLRGATNLPGPRRPGGPPIWLGGQRRRGIALAARYARGWPMPGNRPGDVAYFADRRDAIRAALDAAGRDPDDFDFAAQIACGPTAADRRLALEQGVAFRKAGATHAIIGIRATEAPDGLRSMSQEVAEPLRDRWERSA